jgi:hypothetical protein
MRKQAIFATVESEGGILPTDLLQRIAVRDPSLVGTRQEDYHLAKGDQFSEMISHSWNRLLQLWKLFDAEREMQTTGETKFTREQWLLPLFDELGYGTVQAARAYQIEKKSYAISHSWQHVPIHLVSYKVDLDRLTRAAIGTPRSSPHSLVQELLNRSDQHLWGMVSNGLRLRVLRKNVSLIRQVYVEFDLETMMKGQLYAEFTLLWLLCHQSRFEGEHPEDCWLEKWSHSAFDQGVRILDQLRNGVERAIAILGSGFLSHRANTMLHEQLRSGRLDAQEYYRQILRLVYRLIVLFVAEERDVLLRPDTTPAARELYMSYYSTTHLRRLAERRQGTPHSDLYQALCLVMQKIGSDEGYVPLGLPALNGFLFSEQALPDLTGCQISNKAFLEAIRALAFTIEEGIQRAVDYKNLGSEELGSVYESLLEFHPVLNIEAATFRLEVEAGHERKTTGSYYTPTSLIESLLDSALDPVLDEACKKPDPAQAILDLKICDPACGSGHFLVAAAHRIAKRLASILSGDEEPGPEVRRKALRDVIGRCIYGVDINPMSVELCKVNLWKEAMEPGKPLSFLDAHILEGNSLLGATPALLAGGIPDKAFEAIEGDDKKICSEYRKRNKRERESRQLTLFDPAGHPWEHLGNLAPSMMQLDNISDDTVQGIHSKQEQYESYINSSDYLSGCLLADAWCAAFVWKKTKEFAYPITHEVFWNIDHNPYTVMSWMKEEIIRLRQQYKFFHWHLAFPTVFRTPVNGEEPENKQTGLCGGFDVILSNPPWDRLKIQEKEWFAIVKPDIANAANAAARRKMITALTTEDPELYKAFMENQRQAAGESHLMRDSGRYPLCGRGDVNTYSIFAENIRNAIRSTGRVGCIVPSGIATDDTTKVFFQDLVDSHCLVSLYDFENRSKLFPDVDSRMKFCLLTMSSPLQPVRQNPQFAFFLHNAADLQNEESKFPLSANDIALINPNTRTCPIFRSKRDMLLTKAIYERVPVLIKEGLPEANPWGISFLRMFDMANDSHLFRTREQLEQDNWSIKGNVFFKNGEKCYPLYEGKMIAHFDHHFGGYEVSVPKEGNLTTVPRHDPSFVAMPRYWIHESHIESTIRKRPALLTYRDIARSTDIRTAIFSVIPAVACGHTLPIALSSPEYTDEIFYLLSNASSFVFDYVARQKLGGTHMTYFILNQLPVLPPDHYFVPCKWDNNHVLGMWISLRALELTYTAWDLEAFAKDCGYDGPPFRWDEERRFLLRCELDAAYFHLYGIERDDVDYIMDTFRIWKEKEEKQYGEYRTKRVILEIYDGMQRAIETGEPYQTRLDPPPADPTMAHPPKEGVILQ